MGPLRPRQKAFAKGHTAGSGTPASLLFFESIFLQFPPSFPTSISCSGPITFTMFCKFGKNVAFLEMFEESPFQGVSKHC